MDVDLTIDGETVDGFMILGVEREFLDMAEMDPDQFIDDLGADDIPEGSTVEPWEDDEYVGQRVVLDSVEVSEFDDPEFILIDYDTNAGRYEITGQMDMTDMGDAETAGLPSGMFDALMGSFDMSVSITFPGEIIEANGEIDGSTVTWTPVVGEVNEFHAVATDGSGGLPIGLLVAIGAIILAAIAGLVYFLTRRGSTEPDEQQPSAEPAGV